MNLYWPPGIVSTSEVVPAARYLVGSIKQIIELMAWLIQTPLALGLNVELSLKRVTVPAVSLATNSPASFQTSLSCASSSRAADRRENIYYRR